METWTAIDTTRAIRRFEERALDERDLRRILEAGRRAGSSKNVQAWDFIVCRERDHLQQLAQVGPYAGHLAGAAVGIALVTPGPEAPGGDIRSIWFDLGRAAQNMTLAAWDRGIGSVPATVYDQPLARELLGYPADHWCEYLLSFGYPADPSDLTRPKKAGGRKALEEVVHEERW